MPAPSATAVPSSLRRRVFSGTPTVRGWIGVLAYCALILFGFQAQSQVFKAWVPGLRGIPFYVLVRVLQLAELLLFAWIASRLERRSFAAYGLPWRPAFRIRFWQGAALGIASLSALVLTLSALGGLGLTLPQRVGPEALLVGAGYLLLFVVLGLREEFLYRGYGLSTLARNIGFWPSAMIWSGWFLASHAGNSGETALGLATVGLFGLFACLLLRRTGNLWMPIGFHAAWNWGQTFLFGVSDSGHAAAPGHFFTASVSTNAPAWLSGGATGPEGSALGVALVAMLILGLARYGRQASASASPLRQR
ncbi:MAG TPA: CPBP family intramembrane glutamic endopeptidase [Candidatus Eisenbacteria bacterium]|nr:CPBP family intramembrane glutamic endopeptidase [Candidatus Eisenbacteria bacterium]